jgi:hypothetical protein
LRQRERLYLASVSRTIAAETPEIQRNIVAERGLGLLRSAWPSEGTCMSIMRLYTGPDGQSHLEELDLASHPELTSPQATTHIVFRTTQPGHFSDWHNAPRRQYVITLAGEVEIGLGDGTVHRFGPGHVTLADDLTGKGHTTRVVGNVPRVSATIPLAD